MLFQCLRQQGRSPVLQQLLNGEVRPQTLREIFKDVGLFWVRDFEVHNTGPSAL